MSDKYFSKIITPNGDEVYVKDSEARSDIATLRELIKKDVSFLGITTTELYDGATTNPIVIDGKEVTATSGNFTIYKKDGTNGIEFIWGNDKWYELGSTGALKALAYKDSASGEITPAGTVSQPGITVTSATKVISHITMVADAASETITFGTVDETVVTGATAALDSAPVFTGAKATIVVQ